MEILLKCLVTGGIGFIGFNLCRKLIESHEVIALDNFNAYYDVKLKEMNKEDLVQKGIKVIKEDILNYEKVKRITKDIDIIFHLAAQPGVRYSLAHPLEVFKTNVDGTLNILECARKNKISRFIFASSSSVYGNSTELPLKEDSEVHPIAPYGLSKLVCENYIHFYYKHYNLPTVIFRLFSVVGERQRPDMGIYKFIINLLRDTPLTIFGDGTQTRDWCNVKNVVDAFIKAIDNPKIIGETLNIGHGERISVNKIIEIIENFIGKRAKRLYTKRNEADMLHTQADLSKITKLLNYQPKYSIEEGIKSEIEFIQRNLEKFS